MLNQLAELDRVFQALADPGRGADGGDLTPGANPGLTPVDSWVTDN